jgi:hypoxanthine phosphoribosyltransferase
MRQRLVTRKNRKMRRLNELFPEVRIRILYQRDLEDLAFRLGVEGGSVLVK